MVSFVKFSEAFMSILNASSSSQSVIFGPRQAGGFSKHEQMVDVVEVVEVDVEVVVEVDVVVVVGGAVVLLAFTVTLLTLKSVKFSKPIMEGKKIAVMFLVMFGSVDVVVVEVLLVVDVVYVVVLVVVVVVVVEVVVVVAVMGQIGANHVPSPVKNVLYGGHAQM